jgi:hypothetical protein
VDLYYHQNRILHLEYLGSRVRFADMSAVKQAMGLSESPLGLLFKSKYPPVPEADLGVALAKLGLEELEENDEKDK